MFLCLLKTESINQDLGAKNIAEFRALTSSSVSV